MHRLLLLINLNCFVIVKPTVSFLLNLFSNKIQTDHLPKVIASEFNYLKPAHILPFLNIYISVRSWILHIPICISKLFLEICIHTLNFTNRLHVLRQKKNPSIKKNPDCKTMKPCQIFQWLPLLFPNSGNIFQVSVTRGLF